MIYNGSLKKENILVELESEYKLNDTEYIIDVPYNLNYQTKTDSILTEIQDDVKEIIQSILFKIPKSIRTLSLCYKEIEINGKNLIFYDYNDILQKCHKRIEEQKLIENKDLALTDTTKQFDSKPEKGGWRLQSKGWRFHSSLGKSIHLPKGYGLHGCLTSQYQSRRGITSFTPRTDLPISPPIKNSLDIPMLNPHGKSNKDIVSNYISLTNSVSNKGNLEPEKKLRSFIATSRNLTIVKLLKNLYQDKCQICGETIEISPNCFLSEVHHLKPLGAHNGPDVTENMIVLCPNHHAMFDRGAITIDIEKKIVIHFNPNNPLNNKSIELRHEINRSNIDYHNANIFINSNFAEYQNQEDVIANKDELDSPIQTVDFGNLVTLQDMHTSELFDVKLEDRFNKDFMKPLEKVILQKCLNDIVRYNAFRYKIISICTE